MESVKTGDGRIIIPVAEKDQILLQIPHPGKISVRHNGQCNAGFGLDRLADLLCQLPVTGGDGDHSGRLAVFHQSGLDAEITLHISQSSGNFAGIDLGRGECSYRPFQFHRFDHHIRCGCGMTVKIDPAVRIPCRKFHCELA